MKKYRNIFLILFLIINFLSFKNIDLPSTPEVKEPKFEENNENLFLVRIKLIGKNSLQGYIKFDLKKIKNIEISKIKKIKFLSWKGEHKRKDSYIFYPDEIEIILFDKTKLVFNKKINILNKILFVEEKNKRKIKLYSYYYDYLEKGRWINSNTKEIAVVEKNPLKGTVKEINFIHGRDVDVLPQYLKKIFRNFK